MDENVYVFTQYLNYRKTKVENSLNISNYIGWWTYVFIAQILIGNAH